MSSKLIHVSAYEAEIQFERSLVEAFKLLEPQLRPPFQLNVPSASDYSQLNRAILYGILSEPHLSKVHIKHLHAIVTDGYGFFVSLLTKLVTELYLKLVDSVKVQLIWITSKMIDVLAVGLDGLLVSLLRQIGGGDSSDGNLWLCFELVNLFISKWDCLIEDEPSILANALYTYLRLLADHYRFPSNVKFAVLKQMEIDFCVRVIKEQFHLCLRIGRDLVRLLQDLVHIPEFYVIWKILVLNPSDFKTPGFSDLAQLYCSRTSSRYFLLRITPEMETQLRFLLTHVKLGRQKRHQAWFARKFLCGPERETLICDIVRFICCAHHPTNEVIQSDVIPRWAVIGWLLSCCRKNYVEANVKLALFYDWLFFDERVDNIMNIEPAILLMVNSIPNYIGMTHALLEFLFLLVDNYDVDRSDIINRGVSSSFGMLIRKEVVHSLDALTSSEVLSPVLKDKLRQFLYDMHSGVCKESFPAQSLGCSNGTLNSPYAKKQIHLQGEQIIPKSEHNDKSSSQFVDASVSSLGNMVISHKPGAMTDRNHIDSIDYLIQNLGETYRKSSRMGLNILEKVLFSFVNLLGDGQETEFVLHPEHLSCKIAKVFESAGCKLFAALEALPDQPNHDDEIYSATALIISTFIFSQHERMRDMLLFWSKICLPVRARILSYASRLAYEADMLVYSEAERGENSFVKVSDLRMPLLKFHIDAYTSFLNSERLDSPKIVVSSPKVDKNFVSKLIDDSFAAYRCLLLHSSNILHENGVTSPAELFTSDMTLCSQWKQKTLKYLFCSIFCHVPDLAIGVEGIIRLLVYCLDHVDLLAMQFDVGVRRFSIFGDNNKTIYQLIKRSLSWDSVEQYKLWTLVKSELVVSKVQTQKLLLDFFCSDSLDPNMTSIAVGGFLTLCTCLAPTPKLVGAIMLLPCTVFKDFPATVLASWAVSSSSMLLKSLADFLEKLQNKNGHSPISLGGLSVNEFAISWLLDYLGTMETDGIDNLSKSSEAIPDITARLRDFAVLMESR